MDEAFRQPETFERLSAMLDAGGPRRAFVSARGALAAAANGDGGDSKSTDGSAAVGTATHRDVVVSDGSSVALAGSKVVYFLKTADVDVNPDLQYDRTVICGEVSPNMLGSINNSLSKLYQPHFEARTQWGQAGEAQPQEFSSSVSCFLGELSESMRAITKGVDLRKPDTVKYNLEKRALDNDTLKYAVGILASWCNTIDAILEQDGTDSAGGAGGSGGSGSQDLSTAGPMSELDFWKRRQQKLLSVTEQLKNKDCRAVLALVASTVKSSNPELTAASDAMTLIRRWKQIDINLTEAANEAKDNVKYLFTLEKFIEVGVSS